MITMQVDSLSISIFSLIHVWGGSIVSFSFYTAKALNILYLFSLLVSLSSLIALNVYDTLPN